MKLLDISQAYEPGMRRYRSIDDFSFEWLRHYDQGSGMALSRLHLTSHLGTHMDSPYHYFEDGAKVGDIPLELLCGEALVIDATSMPSISKQFLQGQNLGNTSRLLFKTDNTAMLETESDFDNVYFEEEACMYMHCLGVKLVGTDYFNVDRRGDASRSAHRALLGQGIVILEALALQGIEPGRYELICLPLKLPDLEGAPCRAVLRGIS